MSQSQISDTDLNYPINPANTNLVQGVDNARVVERLIPVRLSLSTTEAATASTTAVKTAVTDTGAQVTVTAGITNPPFPRNLTATAGGTATDIKAIAVTVFGTNEAGEAIQETLPAFTVDTAGTVTGNKAFKTVTSIVIPAHDGVGATTAIGFGDKIGLPHKLTENTVIASYLNKVKEGTAATVAISSTALESNTVDLNSALNGTVVDIDYLV